MVTTATTKERATIWGRLSRKVLSTVLVDHGALFPLLDVIGANARWFAPKEAVIWAAVVQCAGERTPPTVEAVANRCEAGVGYIQQIANQWNEDDGRHVIYHAEELKGLGMLAELRQVGRDLSDTDDPEAVGTAVEWASAMLSGVMANKTSRKADARSVGESAWKELEAYTADGVPTGLGWFDELSGGLWPGFNYWIAGAYKTGKTTLMRNVLLDTARQGVASDVFCAEGSREMFALDCQAMMATRLMCQRGERSLGQLRLSGLLLRRAWRQRKAFLRKDELDAIIEAREIWNGYNIRVWDTVDGIRNLATLRHRIQQSKFDHGSLIHWMDYSQLFGEGGTLFERQSQTAMMVQEIAQAEGVAVCVLAQRNEQAIGGGDSYSVGVKGGGDASAAADFLLVPTVDHELDSVFHIKLKHSRHSGLGNGTHTINRSSGLILDEWFSTEERPICI